LNALIYGRFCFGKEVVMSTRLVVCILVAWCCIVLISRAPVLAGCYPDNSNSRCKGNFDYDCDVDGTDASVFKSDFGRSKIVNPCPSAGPALVSKTGQITSRAIGDDGDLKKGVAWPNPRFTDNGDGTVTDNLTGLIWLKNANCFGDRNWAEALSDCNGLARGSCGLTDGSNPGDWRLPNVRELQSLCHYDYYGPAIPNTAGTGKWTSGDPFSNVQSYWYWSSSNYVNSTGYAWSVFMSDGVVDDVETYVGYYVWPVRGVCS